MHFSKEYQRQLLAATPSIFNEFIMGLSYGWVSPTLRKLQDNPDSELNVSVEEASYIGSLHELGRFLGSLISTWLLSRIGRKGILAISALTFLITFMMIASTRSVQVICASRWIFGIAVGMHDVTSAIYICENFLPSFRGVFGSIGVACFYGGCLIEFCWVNYLDYDTVAYVNCVGSFLALSSIFWSTETAHYLITKKRYEKALKNFLWLRGQNDSSDELAVEFEKIKLHIDEERKEKRTIPALFKNPFYRKTIVIAFLFCLLTNSTGFSAVESFASVTFTEGVLSPNEYTILFGALQFVAAVLGSTFIERVNRRTILIVTLLTAVAVHGSTAALFYLHDVWNVSIPYFSWLTFASITAFAMVYSMGTLPIFYTVRGELLPQNVRNYGGALCIVAHAFIGFFTTDMFLFVAEILGIHWNFVFYGFMSMVSAIFVYAVLPETRGKTLIEIQAAIEMKMKPRPIPA